MEQGEDRLVCPGHEKDHDHPGIPALATERSGFHTVQRPRNTQTFPDRDTNWA